MFTNGAFLCFNVFLYDFTSFCRIWMYCCCVQLALYILGRLKIWSCFHLAWAIAFSRDLIKTQSEEANKVCGGRLLQLRLLTSPLPTDLWDSPLAHIHSPAAIKDLNCSTKAAHRPWFSPPANNIINTTHGVPERLRRADGRLRVDSEVGRDREVLCSSTWSHRLFLFSFQMSR